MLLEMQINFDISTILQAFDHLAATRHAMTTLLLLLLLLLLLRQRLRNKMPTVTAKYSVRCYLIALRLHP